MTEKERERDGEEKGKGRKRALVLLSLPPPHLNAHHHPAVEQTFFLVIREGCLVGNFC